MSKLIVLGGIAPSANKGTDELLDVANAIQESLRHTGSLANGQDVTISTATLRDNEVAGWSTALESLAHNGIAEIAAATDSTDFEVRGSKTPAQLTAMAFVKSMAPNPARYNTAALASANESAPNGVMTDFGGVAGGYGFAGKAHPAMEAFDNSILSKYMGVSTVFNMEVANQRPAAELLFKTVLVASEFGGFEMGITVPYVYSHFLRDKDGAPQNMGLQRLIDAQFDHTVLNDNSLELFPEVQKDGSNTEYFVDAADVAPRDIQLRNRVVHTAPLAFGKELALINISQHSMMDKNGQYDAIDSLDRAIGVKKVYFKVGSDVLGFSVATLPGARFFQGPEFDGREVTLLFRNAGLQINKNTKLVDGGALTQATLAQIVSDELVVNLHVTMSGQVDLETSNLLVQKPIIKVDSVYNANNERLSLEAGVGLDIVNGLADLEGIGYDMDANASNIAYAERGLQLNLRDYRERYDIPLGSPIAIPSPLSEERDGSELAGLISLVKTRVSNNAITKLLNVADRLGEAINNETRGKDVGGNAVVEGIGRFLIREPHYAELVLDVEQVLQTQNSVNKPADLAAALINAIRDMAYDAVVKTGYIEALQLVNGGKDEKARLAIVTDPKISKYLQLTGDTRTFGETFEHVVATDADDRLQNKIFFTFARDTEGPDPLRFGSHLMIPELIAARQVTRNNRTFNEAMVHPRSTHIVHLPVLMCITVTNLDKAMIEYSETKVRVQP